MLQKRDSGDFVLIIPTAGAPFFSEEWMNRAVYTNAGTKYRRSQFSFGLSDTRSVTGFVYRASDRDLGIATGDEEALGDLVCERFGIG